jgi:hypothetical protein
LAGLHQRADRHGGQRSDRRLFARRHRLWIENGEIAYPVSELTIANDLELRDDIPAATLRAPGMTVAGE